MMDADLRVGGGDTVSECAPRGYPARPPSLKLLLEKTHTEADRGGERRMHKHFPIQDKLKRHNSSEKGAFIMSP